VITPGEPPNVGAYLPFNFNVDHEPVNCRGYLLIQPYSSCLSLASFTGSVIESSAETPSIVIRGDSRTNTATVTSITFQLNDLKALIKTNIREALSFRCDDSLAEAGIFCPTYRTHKLGQHPATVCKHGKEGKEGKHSANLSKADQV
jgi:hypothetical protein